MSKFNISAYDRMDQCRAEIAFLRATFGFIDSINLGPKETLGLFLILSRAEDVLNDFLDKDEKDQTEDQEEAALGLEPGETDMATAA